MEQNEPKLVLQLSKGNLQAFNTLFKEYGSRLYYFVLGYLKSEAEAEELVQEVFTRIWEKRKDLKYELSFKSYLFTIAFNLIKRHFKTKAYLSSYYESRLFEEIDNHTNQEIEYESFLQYVKTLIEKLPPRRKEIFIKSRFEGLNINEIADELNINHKTVENQLTEALKYLRRSIKSEALPIILFYSLFLTF